MVASELVEAGRAMLNGFVSPERTTLIASTHRIYATVEKMQMADGRFDSDRVREAAAQLAKSAVLFDMRKLAQESGTVINAVLFGAMAGSGVLPLSREACEQAIRHGGRGAEASLRGFAAGFDIAARQRPAPAEPPPPKRATRVRRRFCDSERKGCTDYQGARYAALYEERLKPFRGGDAKLAAEVARHLALWMAYEDIIRVADLKTRASRFERVRKEVGAKDGEPVVVIDYLKPGVEEFASVLPHYFGKKLDRLGRAPRQARRLQRRHAHQDFEPLRLPAGAQPRLAAPVAADELPLPRGAAADRALARRWSPRRRGATPRWRARSPSARASSRATARRTAAARRNFLAIVDALVDNPPTADAREQAAAIRKAREAALADPEGQALGKTLGKPVVWLKPVT